jgi:hypothetical protein
MKSKFGIVINVYLKGISHELFADSPYILAHRRGVHHNLFVMRCHLKNCLHILAHI